PTAPPPGDRPVPIPVRCCAPRARSVPAPGAVRQAPKIQAGRTCEAGRGAPARAGARRFGGAAVQTCTVGPLAPGGATAVIVPPPGRCPMSTAQAAVLNAVRQPLSVEPLAVRDPRDGEVLVRLAASGVCHSDLHAITGDLPMPLPCVLGHEGAGVVEKVGAGVQRVKTGDHVVLNWVPFCGSCWYCNSGNAYLCELGYVNAMSAEVFRRNGTTINQ